MSSIPPLYPSAALIATALGLHGYRKGSLSLDGAIAAWLVGYGHLANPIKVFGVTMIGMYLIGSRATKVKVDVKAKLEDGPDPLKPSGNRSWIQVLSSSLPGLIAALLYRFGPASQLDESSTILALHPISRPLIYISLGLNATILADTLASELGILSAKQPIYLPTLKPVPKGTNGAISPLGIATSILGGGLIGLIMAIDLLIENPASRYDALLGWKCELVGMGAVMGLAGSLLDSILGAYLQVTYFSTSENKILTDHSKKSIEDQDVKKIGYGIDVLSNSGVNFVCGVALSAVGWYYGRYR
ncbi:uncharacterized protein I303_101759 [Kwoniella dejecticola CBS 10117]|uniref:TIGR00297 family protein n=1 Tax=Kwoniella dejecticola CBS 10117 TaxID=1296121 RepID=A0A1A6ACV9_9TREE|nr:uncharacterized protein I303_02105 [Kwoniella dejecticola CBS 10117]OBR87891.1 hypothetical protein I303_02105 [Kwoniella dejecticola CBS 10117]